MNVQLDVGGRVVQELDHPAAHPGVNDGVDQFVRPICQLTQGPTCVSYDLMIGAEKKPSQSWQGRTDQRKRR